MEILRGVLVMAVKIFISGVLSVAFYWLVLSDLHAAIYTYRMGMLRSDIWIGDGFFLLFESILIVLLECFGFYWLLGIFLKKFRRNEK